MTARLRSYMLCVMAGLRCMTPEQASGPLHPYGEQFFALSCIQEDKEVKVRVRKGRWINGGIARLQGDVLIDDHPGRNIAQFRTDGGSTPTRITQEHILSSSSARLSSCVRFKLAGN